MLPLKFEIITIFPEFFSSPLSFGIVSQAIKRKLVEIHIHDLRDFTFDKHRTVDDRPFGGGEGMVLKPEPLFRAIHAVQSQDPDRQGHVILLTPQGKPLDQKLVSWYSGFEKLVLICGRYEGVDERVVEALVDEEISIGDYVLSGGELAACVFIDAVTRLLPGVLNNQSSTINESFSALPGENSLNSDYPLLDCPHYTRPEDFEGSRVPEVLLSGDHAKIKLWRRKKALEKTLKNRPDLLEYEVLSEEDRRLLNSSKKF
jgi:tRNA (guanine37-N1)-methyltransferase